jgi:hypothetical protein
MIAENSAIAAPTSARTFQPVDVPGRLNPQRLPHFRHGFSGRLNS